MSDCTPTIPPMDALPTRADIEKLQALMVTMPQADLLDQTKHLFADSIYCRPLFRPAGTLIVGKIHKHEHFYVVLSGEVTLAGEGYRERIKAPRIIISQPGVKRAVFAHVDSICATFHRLRTDSRDLDEIERELIEPEDLRLFDSANKPIPEALCHS